MIYELEIEEGKEKQLIEFLKQLDFVSIKIVKERKKKTIKASDTSDLPYFDSCPDWDYNVDKKRKEDTIKRIDGWLC